MLKVLLLLIVLLTALALYLLPWWALLGAFLFLAAMVWLVKGRFITWLFTLPFRAKGKVLRKASVEVHSIRPAEAPPEKPSVPRRYFEVDLTITPRPPTGVFTFWEIGELMLVAPGKRWDDEDDSCEVVKIEVMENGKFVPDEGYKLPGPQRLRLMIGVKPGVSRLVFGYYLERFGEIRVPVEVPASRSSR